MGRKKARDSGDVVSSKLDRASGESQQRCNKICLLKFYSNAREEAKTLSW